MDHISRSKSLQLASGKGRTVAFEEIIEVFYLHGCCNRRLKNEQKLYGSFGEEIDGLGSLLEVGIDVTPK